MLVFGLALLVLSVVLLLGGSDSPSRPQVPSGYVAVVEGANGKVIKLSNAEFERRLPPVVGNLGEVPELGNEKLASPQASTLAYLVQSAWIEQEAKKLGIAVSEDEVEERVAHTEAKYPGLPASYARYTAESSLLTEKVRQRSPGLNLRLTKQWVPRTHCASGFFSLQDASGAVQKTIREYCGEPGG